MGTADGDTHCRRAQGRSCWSTGKLTWLTQESTGREIKENSLAGGYEREDV